MPKIVKTRNRLEEETVERIIFKDESLGTVWKFITGIRSNCNYYVSEKCICINASRNDIILVPFYERFSGRLGYKIAKTSRSGSVLMQKYFPGIEVDLNRRWRTWVIEKINMYSKATRIKPRIDYSRDTYEDRYSVKIHPPNDFFHDTPGCRGANDTQYCPFFS